jgi:hypothetical protein
VVVKPMAATVAGADMSFTAAINSGLLVWSAGHGGVGGRAVDWSLAAFCIAVAARHDAIVRGVFVLGRLVPSYRLHQLTYHLGQLHRAMAVAGMAWLAVAVALAVPSSPVARMASAIVLAIGIAMARTARDRAALPVEQIAGAVRVPVDRPVPPRGDGC